MVSLLTQVARRGSLAFALLSTSIASAQDSDRHQFDLSADIGYFNTSGSLGAWPEGGVGKLRYDDSDDRPDDERIYLDYHGRISPEWNVRAVVDFVDDGDRDFGFTEAWFRYRPVPKSANQHQWRLGAFYPVMSLENPGSGWRSPYTISFSAINTWLGEEIRPLGAEWSVRRRLADGMSAHEIKGIASVFYGTDPAGTLLFWRGWSLHDRQTRLNERIEMPPYRPFGSDEFIDQSVEPLAEVDRRPGYYAGFHWSWGQRITVQLARYDNRARVNAFGDSQWAWRTAFNHVGVQADLPGEFGLIAQWMDGGTDWITGARPNGEINGPGRIAKDHFASKFVLLTRAIAGVHRVSLRYDTFDVWRRSVTSIPEPDKGLARTIAYRYEGHSRLDIAVEWLEIASSRDLWSQWYDVPRSNTERQLRIQLNVRLLQ